MADDNIAPPKRQRLPQADRMAAIARVAAELFAERGFHATGSRDLAKASGVSEALLFRYFPNKEELWKAALESCRHNAIAESLRSLPEGEPSTGALVALTWELAEDYILGQTGKRVQDRNTIHRMLLRSLAEDGEFARLLRSDLTKRLTGHVLACLKAAREAGDLDVSPGEMDRTLVGLFHLPLFAAGVYRLPTPPVLQTGSDDRELLETLVRFQLRGVGLTLKAIERELDALKRRTPAEAGNGAEVPGA